MSGRMGAVGRRLGAVAMIALLVAAVLVSAGCGDPYSGTWTREFAGGETSTLTITKGHGGWVITDSLGGRVVAYERDGRLTPESDPSQAFERDGDELILLSDGVEAAVYRRR